MTERFQLIMQAELSKTSKRWDLSIEMLKAIAAILVLNSHMDAMYGQYHYLGTGGTLGDALFFFCSGYGLFLSNRQENFFNWYKRRIQRIYPSVIVVALMGATYIISKFAIIANLGAPSWFIVCILLYYVIIYPIKKYASNYLWWIMLGGAGIVVAWYFLLGVGSHSAGNIYGQNYFKWGVFFIYMLFGAICGRLRISQKDAPKPKAWINGLGFIVSVITFYSIFFYTKSIPAREPWQLFTIIPLLGVCWFLWRLCCSEGCTNMMNNKYVGSPIRFVGGLCLEILITQRMVLTTSLNSIFPFNIPIIMLGVIGLSYFVRCLGRVLLQTFQKEDYDWRDIIAPY